ncbi:MAG: hypothetical protein K0V04_35505 [Deltaproteobacteria bacterium]|nr:hypothetical protein [Deltaproteobacteria bacterium]
MACLATIVRSWVPLLSGAFILTACPDNPLVSGDTDGPTTGVAMTDTGTVCVAGQTQSCICNNGTDGTQTCVDDGSGFGSCECDADSLDSASGTTSSDTTTGDDTTGTTGPTPCMSDEECADAAKGECQVGVCGEDGMCVAQDVPFDTPCGDQTDDECTTPDTCNNGTCMPNHLDDGLVCSTCPSGQCTCSEGACGECNVFAATNNFITDRSIEGWALTGSWALRRQTPQSEVDLASVFPGQVLGSDGNRVAPYPGSEIEVSYARTPTITLPNMIAFLSWNVDQGGGISDNKTVRISVDDGMTWELLADCSIDASPSFCTPIMERDPAVWDLVQIPIPPAFQGQPGIVEFGYDTGDACCNFEKGWYIDSLNVATECVCSVDEDCSDYTTTCGTAICSVSGECGLMPMPLETVCGDPFANDCNGADTCDGVGYCGGNELANGLVNCGDCPGGGPCSFCDAGQCLDCLSFSDFGDFNDPGSIAEWQVTGISGTPGWGLYNEAPTNSNGTPAVVFPNAPVFGTDGNREVPYPGGHTESSQVVTGEGTVPASFTFISWNVDEGSGFDTKRIELSVDGGMTWNMLVDCDLGATQPFCFNVADGRLATDWDPIALDTSMWAGQQGQIRFTYNTGDSCCGFEQGWYIDDLNAFSISCNDMPFTPPPPVATPQ